MQRILLILLWLTLPVAAWAQSVYLNGGQLQITGGEFPNIGVVKQTIGTPTLSANTIPAGSAQGTNIGTVAVSMPNSTPGFAGTGSFVTSGTDSFGATCTNYSADFQLPSLPGFLQMGSTGSSLSAGTYNGLCVKAAQAGTTNASVTKAFSIIVTASSQGFSSVAMSCGTTCSFTSGVSGASVGSALATLSPTSPAFSGSWSVASSGVDNSGTTCNTAGGTDFSINGTTGAVTTSVGLAAGTYSNICITATQSGVTGSPYTQAFDFTGSSTFIGTFWNGSTYNIPSSAVVTNSTAGSCTIGHACLDLTSQSSVSGCTAGTSCPYGIGIYDVTVNNTTINYPYSDSVLTVHGCGNTINARATQASYQGAQAHNHLVIDSTGCSGQVGNNTAYAASSGGTDAIVYGTSNTITGHSIAMESEAGNTWNELANSGTNQQGGIALKALTATADQGYSPWPSTGAIDTINFSSILQHFGCTLASPSGNGPSTCAGTSVGGSSAITYDPSGANNYRSVGTVGRHYYCIVSQGNQCSGAASNFPQNYFTDCNLSGTSETLAQFLANPGIITGGTAPTEPAQIAANTVSWPCNISAPEGPSNCPLGPNTAVASGLVTISGTPTIVVMPGLYQYTSGWNGVTGVFVNIVDAYGLASDAVHPGSVTSGVQFWIGAGFSITNATWSGGLVTFTLSSSAGIASGAIFDVQGAAPSGYDGQYTATTGTSGTTVVASLASNPGTWTGNGTLMTLGSGAGFVTNTGGGSLCGGSVDSGGDHNCYKWTNQTPSELHEIVVSSAIRVHGTSATSDTLFITTTNSADSTGIGYTTSYPIKWVQGVICP